METAFVWSKEDLISCPENISPTIPNKIQPLDGVEIKSISSGPNHTLICLQDGSVRICVHDHTQYGSRSILSGASNIVKGLVGKKVIQVAAGNSHSVVLTENNEVYTWGEKNNGQLGRANVNRKNRKQPKLVRGLDNHRVLQISCGNDHTLALTDDGVVFVWGSNKYGQLGLGEHGGSHKDLPEVITCLTGIPVLQIVAGGDHSFILSKSGSLYAWGRNDFGQLGLGDVENKYLPMKCRLANDQKIKYVCCGENHTACLTVDGSVLTFGAGSSFQLGHCSNKNASSPKKVMELSNSEVCQIACGREHTLAYVPNSGILYVFGQGENVQFGLSRAESNSSLASASSPFVVNNEHPLSYFSMQLDNQDPQLRIKSIHAGGNHSLVMLVPANKCDSDDFRKEDPATQIPTLSEERIRNLKMSEDGNLSEEILKEIGKIFSSPSCLNGSFLLPNNKHYESNSQQHGVDMAATREFFNKFLTTSGQLKFISTELENNLMPALSTLSHDAEALRLYLILPELKLFDQPEFYSSVISQFVKSFLSLESAALELFDSWWKSNQPSFFKTLVRACMQCLQYFLWLPTSEDTQEEIKRQQDLLNLAEMLQKLYKVNREKNIIDDTTFVVPNLKDKVDIKIEYPKVFHLERNKPIQTLYFSNYPFLFDVETKSTLLQLDAELQKGNMQTLQCLLRGDFNRYLLNQEPINYYSYSLTVDRKSLVNDTLYKLGLTERLCLKLPLAVKIGTEKAGSDGVLKEFFRLFFQGAMDPDFGMFTIDDSSQLGWFNSSNKKYPEMFGLVGILCGLVIYNSVATDLHFPLALYKKLLKRPVAIDDLTELMPVISKSLQCLLDYDADDMEDRFCQPFQWGDASDNELCAGGADIMVNQNNKDKYVDLVVDYLLNKTVKTQFDAFSEGFHFACGGTIMDSFCPDELMALLEGNEDYDFVELEKNTSYEGGVYYKRHPTIILFWEVFHEMSLADKKKFLLFLTGSARIPITGMKNIKIIIRPQLEGLLPTSLTCHIMLLLPPYKTKEQLAAGLLISIGYTEGFFLNMDVIDKEKNMD